MKSLVIAAFLCISAQTGHAILSPLNQSAEEINTILTSPELQKAFPQSEPIMNIKHLENGYLLTAKSVQMHVEIIYAPSHRPGRQQFQVKFYNPTPINQNRPQY